MNKKTESNIRDSLIISKCYTILNQNKMKMNNDEFHCKGILEILNEEQNSGFDKNFIVKLSSRDPYDLMMPIESESNISNRDHYQYFSSNGGDFFLEFQFKKKYEINGFSIQTTYNSFPRQYKIYVDNKLLYETPNDDSKLNGEYKISTQYDLPSQTGRSFRIEQKGQNFDETIGKDKFIGLGRIEIYTTKHSYHDSNVNSGLFSHMRNKSKYKQDPHLFPVKIRTNKFMTDDIHNINTNKKICTTCVLNSYCEIQFLKGYFAIESYKLIRDSGLQALKGWKITGFTKDGKEINLGSNSYFTTLDIPTYEIEVDTSNYNKLLEQYDLIFNINNPNKRQASKKKNVKK